MSSCIRCMELSMRMASTLHSRFWTTVADQLAKSAGFFMKLRLLRTCWKTWSTLISSSLRRCLEMSTCGVLLPPLPLKVSRLLSWLLSEINPPILLLCQSGHKSFSVQGRSSMSLPHAHWTFAVLFHSNINSLHIAIRNKFIRPCAIGFLDVPQC